MFKNYWKTAWRSITKSKTYSIINVVGLTIGLCACMIVATVVLDDLSYDSNWSRGNDLYRIISINKMGDGLYDRSAYSLAGMGNKLKNDYPEVEAVSNMSTSKFRIKLNDTNPNGVEVNALNADTSFWKILDMKVLAGNPKKYIDGIGNVVISESFSKKFFPNENPVGKIIHDVPAYSDKAKEYQVTGIIQDIPSNTVLRSDIILIKKDRDEELNTKQYGSFSQYFILFKQGTDVKKFTEKLNNWYAGYVEVKNPYRFEFQPMKDVYLHSDFENSQEVKEDSQTIYIFSGVALLLLIIACVNFVNLSTARAVHRLKETGIRKILGANRRQLIAQFLSESVLYFIISTIAATIIYQLSRPLVQNYLGYKLGENYVSKFPLLITFYIIILFISILTGLYPAWIMSGFKPAATLKGKLFSGSLTGQNTIRKSLVVLQFAISIFVLIAMVVVQQQVSFMKNKDVGFNKNNLLSIGFVSWDGKGNAFKNEILNQPGILDASITSWIPARGSGFMSREIDDPNHSGNKLKVWYINGDVDLAKTLGLHLKSGRFLNRTYSADAISQDSLMNMDSLSYVKSASRQSSIITAYTAKILQVKSLDKVIDNVKTTAVGIVQDFNNESLKNAMEPTIIIADPEMNYGGMLIRIKPGFEKTITASINKTWREFYPEKLLEIKWVDDMLAEQYKTESKLQQLFTFFSALSMFLAALGIFGLIVQATSERVKEIGIRKVLGASVKSIVGLFSIDFLKLILIAIFIASPVAWLLMNQWLLDYAYRIQISWWIFVVAGIIAIFIAFITISFLAIKAARANPVKSLRSE